MVGIYVFGFICFVCANPNKGGRFSVVYGVGDGINAIKCRITGEEASVRNDEYLKTGYILEREEYEQLSALSEDSNEEAVILYTLPEDKEEYAFFRTKMMGSFSGKYIMRDDQAISEMVKADVQEYNKLLNIGVRYILVDFCQESDVIIPDIYARMIYDGERMRIYEIISRVE